MYGKRLRELRESLGLSQGEFADALGIPQTTLSGYERERTQPKFEFLNRLCSLYSVDLGWLLGIKTDYRDVIGDTYDDFADLVGMGFSTDEAYRMERAQFEKYGDMVMRLNYDDRKKVVDLCEKLYSEEQDDENNKR